MGSKNGSKRCFFWNSQFYWLLRDVLNEILTFRELGHPKNRVKNDKKTYQNMPPEFCRKIPQTRPPRGSERGSKLIKMRVEKWSKKSYEKKSNFGLQPTSGSGVSRSGKGVRGKGKPFQVLNFCIFVYEWFEWWFEWWFEGIGLKGLKDWRVDTIDLNHLTPRGLVGFWKAGSGRHDFFGIGFNFRCSRASWVC